MEIKLRQGDKKMKAFSSKLVKETQNIEKEDEEVYMHVHVIMYITLQISIPLTV